MELTFSQLRSCTFGAERIWEEAGRFCFSRCTDVQREAFYQANEEWGGRCEATAGIRLDFHTDARLLTVQVAAPGKYEVLADDLAVLALALEADGRFSVPLPPGDTRVTVVLPSHSVGALRSVALQDSSYIRPHRHRMKLAFYGDSITQGWDAAKDSQSFSWLLTRYFDADSRNYGVGGITFLPRTVENTGFDPDCVIVALGTNLLPTHRTLQRIRQNCEEYFGQILCRYAGSKLFCITPLWRGDEDQPREQGSLMEIRAIICQEAMNRGISVLDGLTLLPHRPEYFADGYLHPNDLGFALMAQNLIKQLKFPL